ncbi:hypothetical protein [Curtobacterium sp. ISL-83]|uniref:hypothetical protein n=1 Tax=Curtobacterium sp. ISL-83 TaxID=2819145 RepID=UPI0020352495|nr:hypothetical protein [Curtobacterium sp. ISL-83]
MKRLAAATGISIPGDEEHRENRVAGLGPLLGISTGILVGAALGTARALGWTPRTSVGVLATAGAALMTSNLPMTALKVTDPRRWSVTDWISDLVPHLAYGTVAYLLVASATRPPQR